MKAHISIFLLLMISGCSAQPVTNVDENKRSLKADRKSIIDKPIWLHGSPDCDNNKAPVHDAYMHSEKTIIIRQNKCITFEAPFIYVLVGDQKILVLDTGAIHDKLESSLDKDIEMFSVKSNSRVKKYLLFIPMDIVTTIKEIMLLRSTQMLN